jgi:hypothetical protein
MIEYFLVGFAVGWTVAGSLAMWWLRAERRLLGETMEWFRARVDRLESEADGGDWWKREGRDDAID